jgi:DbpA RNA binding domain
MPSYTVGGPPAQSAAEKPLAERSDEGEGFLQLFINVGKREGVAPDDLQKLLSEAGIAPENTGGIRVRDRMSFVRVRKELFDRAVTAFAGRVFGGRPVVAELARPRA